MWRPNDEIFRVVFGAPVLRDTELVSRVSKANVVRPCGEVCCGDEGQGHSPV